MNERGHNDKSSDIYSIRNEMQIHAKQKDFFNYIQFKSHGSKELPTCLLLTSKPFKLNLKV